MKQQITPEIEQQLEQVAVQNGMSLDTLEWNIFRKIEVEGWREDIIWVAQNRYDIENPSEEFINIALDRMDARADSNYSHWDNIENAVEYAIDCMEEN